MPAETRRGRATRDAFAKALIKRLQNGEQLAEIPVRNLAADCDVDRQTFYYHFKNMNELAEYAYDREIEELLESCLDEGAKQKDWKDRARIALGALQDRLALLNNAGSLIGNDLLWKNIEHRVGASLLDDLGSTLDEYGFNEEAKASSIKKLSIAITSIYIAWTSHHLECTLEEALDSIETIRDDYIAGLAARYA